MGRLQPDLVSVLEAAYRVELPRQQWLEGLVQAIRPAAEDGLGMMAYLYDTARYPFQVEELMHDCPVDETGVSLLLDSSNDEYVRRSWASPSAATASETPGYTEHPAVLQVFHPAGIRDLMVINARDPLGVGCFIGAPQRELKTLSSRERERWSRLASHIRAALRLRLRLAQARVQGGESSRLPVPAETSGATEAVLTPTGKVLHLEPAAESSADALREAVASIERARGELRADGERALPTWKSLAQARWTLIDEFENDGKRYVVARANALSAVGLELLSPRERQVVASAAMGHTNKEIAYELGLSHSTVRVLLRRACQKLGLRTRDELVEHYRKSALG